MTTRAKSEYSRAIGLEYEADRDKAPTVTVSCNNLSAAQVVKIARRFGVPVVEDSGLARALSGVEVDQAIPEELYQAVAILINRLERVKKC
ncbi:MAG: flagellar biosynthesis protein FlhB [Candidatus Dadabacteria bacterium]|nr:MAG: flagellar biosynthesis protein FlhB [Candidatus Dadabacteria bacterium]